MDSCREVLLALNALLALTRGLLIFFVSISLNEANLALTRGLIIFFVSISLNETNIG